MATLAETQRAVRDAVVSSTSDDARPLLIGGADPMWRLGIHRRHYHASLVDAIRNRYPATAWLIGDRAVTEAARRYVAAHPPHVFCIAEFGEDFPQFLASEASLSAVPYLADFARLEWHVGHASVAVSRPALTLADLAAADPSSLMLSTLTFQPGVVYLSAAWPVDTLMRIYLSDQVPPQLMMESTPTHMEVHGSRGSLEITSLAPATWRFRSQLQSQRAIGMAAEDALELDPQFDPGRALIELCERRFLTGLA